MIRGALIACLTALPAGAQEILSCDIPQANARNVALPWETASRSYAEGAIRLIALDAGEPGCCGWHLMVLFPEGGGEPWQDCRVVSWRPGGFGFGGIELALASASYDPARGLSVRVPVRFFDGRAAEAGFVGGEVGLLVNQATGSLEAWLEGAPD